jgi:hypothetical protein
LSSFLAKAAEVPNSQTPPFEVRVGMFATLLLILWIGILATKLINGKEYPKKSSPD